MPGIYLRGLYILWPLQTSFTFLMAHHSPSIRERHKTFFTSSAPCLLGICFMRYQSSISTNSLRSSDAVDWASCMMVHYWCITNIPAVAKPARVSITPLTLIRWITKGLHDIFLSCSLYRSYHYRCSRWLTHWGRVTHICVSNLTIIGSDNGLSPDRRQAII